MSKTLKLTPKNEWVSCVGYSAQEYPDFKKGWGVECFNGTKGTIEAYHNPYLYIEGQVDKIHKMNVKAYMTFEQPLSVNKDFEVDEEKNKSDKEIIDIALGKFKNFGKQPNVEDNSWDEVRKEYFNYVANCRLKGITYLDLFKWLQQHYTLIKK